ncbi:TIGR03986 family type III CRISPR-associated RAMP protein [Lacrimispora aerotolerans]|uniref:TIGR03986 family type III CRISPR-associated RAMP protein n=1 Tax=Lacrimispora aerotolerans TaxID=36832 RepID=UPI00047DAFD9|nr:TIGR03986 family CRISPR-associated RAMP protein [Lacrimispora aerotolerans]
MKTKWQEDTKERFINPYNFIPLEEKVSRKKVDLSYKDSYTGYFQCKYQLLTPLIIPNTSSNQAFYRDGDDSDSVSYDFFSYENLNGKRMSDNEMYRPVIPGSEIRGAVRSVHEAAFCGCMSTVTTDHSLDRRSPKPKRPGVLKYESGEWKLYPCKRAMLNVERKGTKIGSGDEKKFGEKVLENKYKEWSEGQKIYVCLGDEFNKTRTEVVSAYSIDYQKSSSDRVWQCGYLHKGEAFLKKHHESVFIKNGNKPFSVKEEDIRALGTVISQYQKNAPDNTYKKISKPYKDYKIDKDKTIPVYYYKDNGNAPFSFSPACIGRELTDNSISAILEHNGAQPCEDSTCVCPTCSIFGMASNKKGNHAALSSRIRFSDASVSQDITDEEVKNYYLPPVFLEQGEPKPGTVEFYTYQPEGLRNGKNNSEKGYWTYDYFIDNNKNRQMLEKGLPKLRGRKYYWHSEVKNSVFNNHKKLGPMNQRVRPLKSTPESIFEGKVFFENLSKEELMQLKWALDFHDKSCAHKIGRAKPLGFGSTKIIIDSAKVREIDMETGEWLLRDLDVNTMMDEFSVTGESEEVLKIIANWEKRPELINNKKPGTNVYVSYPIVKGESKDKENNKNSNASHQWFNGNRNRLPGSNPMNPTFAKVLPEVKEEVGNDSNKWLYKLVKK